LIVAGERLVCDDDALQPLDRRHRVPAWHNRAHRKSMFWWESLAIHSVRELHVALRLHERDAAGKRQFPRRAFWVVEHAVVRSFENDLTRV
jgi:hypothetical protein